MTKAPPEEWAELSSYQRDLLVSLDTDGPHSGNGMWRRFGKESTPATTHRHLNELIEHGYVTAEKKDGRENIYEVTPEGRKLLETAREWMDV